jgi:hypothetical protein
MTICQCCGHIMSATQVRASSASTIWVDAALLDCCNSAYARAEADGSLAVEVAHLVCAMAGDQGDRAALEALGLDSLVLARRAQDALKDVPLGARGRRPRTSQDLKTVIERARREAARRGVDAATLGDCLRVLLYESHDLGCGRAIAAWCRDAHCGRSRGLGKEVVGVTERAPLTAPLQARVAHEGRAARAASVAAHPAQPPLAALPQRETIGAHARSVGRVWTAEVLRTPTELEILERLARQEQLLAEVGAQLAAREEQAAARATSAKTVRRKTPAPVLVDAPATDVVAAMPVTEAARKPAPAPAPPPAPVAVQRVKLRDRLRRGGWLNRRGLFGVSALVAVPERSDRGPMLSLVPAAAQARMSLPPGVADLSDDEDEVDDLEDDAGDELAENGERVKRFYLSLDDEIVRAPSIGPKTAARIIPHGIVRVRDLLGTDARKLAARIGARHITAERIVLWQDQARLVCTVPWLRGTHAQILVGAGFNTVRKILAAEPIVVCAAIRIFATTRDGQRVLRAGPPPDDARVFRWVAHAQVAEADRAA